MRHCEWEFGEFWCVLIIGKQGGHLWDLSKSHEEEWFFVVKLEHEEVRGIS